MGPESDRVLAGDVELGEKELRDPQVDQHVSLVSQVPEVRRAMVRKQRELAASGKMVMVGRDIGTVVLPSADLKVFLSASVQIRARRRRRDLLVQGHDRPFRQILRETVARDHIDSHRADSPLLPADGALQLDTGDLSIDEVVDLILARTCRGSREVNR
jgi:cytidylate kinase